MATETTNYGLHKPVITDNVNTLVENLSSDMDVIDAQLKTRETADTTINNRIDNLILEAGDSSTEVIDARHSNVSDITYTVLVDRLDAMQQGSSVTISSTIPATPYDNQMIIDTNLDIFKYYDTGLGVWKPLVSKNGVFYLEDTASSTDAYLVNVIGLSLFTGMCVNLKVNTSNTGACTFSIDNGSNYKSIVKGISTALETGDILANQIIQLVYNGTNWVLISNSYNNITTINSNIGSLSSLTTTDKSSIVNAINEIETEVANLKMVEEKTAVGINPITQGSLVWDVDGSTTVAKTGSFLEKSLYYAGTDANYDVFELDIDKWVITGEISNYGLAGITTVSNGVLTHTLGNAFDYPAIGGTVTKVSACKINSTKFAIAYVRTISGETRFSCIIVSVSGTTKTLGTIVDIDTIANTTIGYYNTGIKVCLVDTDKIAVVYNKFNGSGYVPKCAIATISGTTPTFGSIVDVDEASHSTQDTYNNLIGLTAIDTNKIAIAYKYTNTKGYCIVATISTTTPSFGTRAEFENAEVTNISITKLDTNKAIIAYTDVGNSNYGTTIPLTVSTTTPSFGTAVVFSSATTAYVNIIKCSSNAFLISYVVSGYIKATKGGIVENGIGVTSYVIGLDTAYNVTTATTTYAKLGIGETTKQALCTYIQSNSGYAQLTELDPDGVADSGEDYSTRKVAVRMF